MRKNYRSWVRFGQDNYHSVDYDNLVFVTGVDLTSSCDMLAYQKSSNDMSASFSFDIAAFGSASLSAWKDRQQPEWSWPSSGSDDYLSSLAPPAPSGPFISIDGSANSLPRQCIFLRGWRLGFLRAPTRIEASAGPDDAGSPPSPSVGARPSTRNQRGSGDQQCRGRNGRRRRDSPHPRSVPGTLAKPRVKCASLIPVLVCQSSAASV
jgi:hypothetical protein